MLDELEDSVTTGVTELEETTGAEVETGSDVVGWGVETTTGVVDDVTTATSEVAGNGVVVGVTATGGRTARTENQRKVVGMPEKSAKNARGPRVARTSSNTRRGHRRARVTKPSRGKTRQDLPREAFMVIVLHSESCKDWESKE